MTTITPWWQAMKLRAEVSSNEGNIDDVQMSLYKAVYGDPPAPYGDPVYYGAITYPTATLAALLGRVAVRLGGGDRYAAVKGTYHLDQGMGGGKSHGLIGLYHMAKSPEQFAATDIGIDATARASEILGGAVPKLDGTRVVVLSADNMTPYAPDDRPHMDGPARSLWERFLWRLVGHDYEQYTLFKDRSDKEGIREALRSVGGPVLILIDEIMDYVRQLDDDKYNGVRNADLSFLRALLDAADDVPHVAMVLVMIGTDKDRAVYDADARNFRAEILDNLIRNGTRTDVAEARDFSQIIRRRLFENAPSEGVVAATAEAFTSVSPQWAAVMNRVPGYNAVLVKEAIQNSYPFHPDLLRLVESEWASLAGYQRVRSTVTLFAQTIYTWTKWAGAGGWAPLLLGPGDMPLEQTSVREALLGSGVIESETTVANYRQVVANDIVSEGGASGAAAAMDAGYAASGEAWATANPRASRRMATALLMYSLAPRSGGKLGATEAELESASFVPGAAYAATDAETVFNALRDTETGLATLEVTPGAGGQASRYYLTTRQTLRMLTRMQRNAVTEKERDEHIAAQAERLITRGGGFTKSRFITDEPDSEGRRRSNRDILADVDETSSTRLVVLDSSRWTLLNGVDDETRQAIRMVFGVEQGALPVTHAASLTVACANTYRRSMARQRAGEYLAWSRVAAIQNVRDDPGMLAEANRNVEEAKRALDKEVKRAYQHYAYLVRDAEGKLEVKFAKFEEDTKTALSGANVWDALVDAGRAVTPGALTVEGLMLSVQDELPRSLQETTKLFWTNPRMPMVSGVDELRRALYEALRANRLELVSGDGTRQPVPDRPNDLPIASPIVSVRLPVPVEVAQSSPEVIAGGAGPVREPGPAQPYTPTGAGAGTAVQPAGGSGGEGEADGRSGERTKLWMKAQANLANPEKRASMDTLILRLLNLVRMYGPDDVENMALTIEVWGDKGILQNAADVGQRLEGTQPRFEDLPS